MTTEKATTIKADNEKTVKTSKNAVAPYVKTVTPDNDNGKPGARSNSSSISHKGPEAETR
ncbi:hypothetical protein [Mucilaginibacter aquaedulcis]|uniref:hypothetical protein n=1 Tax=Mucilaginibacter aquaedulcis TaxID=1187081 RepID=UPI0025B403C6|nr:hypothetical protein [Mucilaginibacter aquaedulcis]MDN3551156.1 hypothetical protein [Mucilaginibacter aquaedulcis]